MKRFFTIITLFLVAVAWTTVSARWVIGERKSASDIKAGDTVVISYAGTEIESGYYLQVPGMGEYESLGVIVAPGIGIGDAAIITFEDGPRDIRTDEPTMLLKMVGSNKYISSRCYDWYDKGQNTVESAEEAGNFQILSCGEEIPWYDENDAFTWWSKESNAAWDDKSVGFSISPTTTDFCYLAYWNYSDASPRAITWKYTSTIQWNVYSVTYEKDLRGDLELLINSYMAESYAFLGGTDPGFYDEAKLNAYNSLVEKGLQMCYDETATDADLAELYAQLQNAYKEVKTSMNPVTEGYYYLINDNEKIAENGMPEKAMYINTDINQVYWGKFDSEDSKFLFHITPYDDTQWNLYNIMTGQYPGKPEGFCDPFASSPDNSFPSTFIFYPGTGSCLIKTAGWTMTVYGNDNGEAEGPGRFWAYNREETAGGNLPHHEGTWRLCKVTDQTVIDRVLDDKKQFERTALLKELSKEAYVLYDKLFVFDADMYTPLITDADKQVEVTELRYQGVDYANENKFLIDKDPKTYVQSGGYIEIDLSENPHQTIGFHYVRRDATWGEPERPAEISIFAANDTVNGGDWKKISDISMGELQDPIVKGVDMGCPYKFVRYAVNTNKDGNNFFTVGEFQIYPATANETLSQYHSVAGMKPAADRLKLLVDSLATAIDNNSGTQDDIANLQAAIAGVRTYFADTAILADLIKECYDLASITTVGDAVGQVQDETLINDLVLSAIDAEEKGLKSHVTKAELDAIISELTAKRDKLVAAIKTFEVGKWYYILNGDATEESATANAALYMTGVNADNAVGVGQLYPDGSAAYTYNPYAMWSFNPGADGTYTIQNLGTGFYLADFEKADASLLQSYKGVPYKVNLIGSESYSIVPQSAVNKDKLGLTAKDGAVKFEEAISETPSSWKIVEIDPEELEFVTITGFGMNTLDIIALPFEMTNLAECNEDVHLYGIRKITQDDNGESTIEFYEKESAKAGESCLIVLGNPQSEPEPLELLIPFPKTVTDKAKPSNGIYGMLTTESIKAGDVFSTGGELVAAEGDVTIVGHTGAIVPGMYKGEVTGETTDLTIVVKGMGPIPAGSPADVDGDGCLNTVDVISVYNCIQNGENSGVAFTAADVNGDSMVDSIDVVAIYNAIAGSSASSPAYKAVAARIMAK